MDRPQRSNGAVVALVAVVVIIAGMGTCAYLGFKESNAEPPDFPLLTDSPDPTLHGTVAYLDQATYCIRLIAASGAASKELYCLDEKAGGDGPVLSWLPDGRLDMVMYDFPSHQPLVPRWHKILNVDTLEVEDASLEGVPEQPRSNPEPAPTPDGRAIFIESRDQGTIAIKIQEPSGMRALLTASGNSLYGIAGGNPVWSPDFQWLLVDDGRLLIVTVADPAVVRTLVADPADFEGSGISTAAVTGEDLLAAG